MKIVCGVVLIVATKPRAARMQGTFRISLGFVFDIRGEVVASILSSVASTAFLFSYCKGNIP